MNGSLMGNKVTFEITSLVCLANTIRGRFVKFLETLLLSDGNLNKHFHD